MYNNPSIVSIKKHFFKVMPGSGMPCAAILTKAAGNRFFFKKCQKMNKNVAKVVKHAWGRIVILLGTCSSSIRWDYRHFLRHFNFVFINYFFFMFEKEYTDNKKKERTLDVPIHISMSGPRMAVCSSFSHFSLTTTIWLLQITIKIFPRRFNPNESLKNVHWLFRCDLASL